MLKPLIKYSGGKFKEYDKFKQFFPEDINNYYEPFFGGGGVFFRLHNDGKVKGSNYINDYSDSLIEFYQSVSSDTFSVELNKVSDAWDYIKNFSEEFYAEYGETFGKCITEDKDKDFFTEDMANFITSKTDLCPLNLHGFSLSNRVIKSLIDKISRFRKKEITEDINDTSYKCITTCICQAFYFIIRDMYNDWNNRGHKNDYTMEERSAQWVFIREYCFGSMFRFGPNGDFNIPYGGFGYNSKNFTSKIQNITNNEAKKLFKETNIQCNDFETVINKWNIQENDFMFLDPPYDSTFSEYDGNGFTREDHKRLANCLKNVKGKWLMAIGKTDFIADLYKDYYIVEYDKTYMYQARGGEYDGKKTTHLVITNYPITKKKQQF